MPYMRFSFLLSIALETAHCGAQTIQLDPSFHDDGLQGYDLYNGDAGVLRDVLVQPDGGILLGGFRWDYGSGVLSRGMVKRILPDGDEDDVFGYFGQAELPFDNFESEVLAMALQSDGKIVLVGFFQVFNVSERGLFVARLTPDGEFDDTFSGDGYRTLVVPDTSIMGTDVVIRPDGADNRR